MVNTATVNVADGFETRRFRYEGKSLLPAHAHAECQFVCVFSGVLYQETESGVWIVPQQRLMFIPPGTLHSRHSHGVVEGWLVLTSPAFAEHLPDRACVLRASSLLNSALERLTEPQADQRLFEMLAPVIRFEVQHARAEELQIPLPRTPGLRAIAQQLIAAPDDTRGLDDWASAALMSTRSFTRHFEAETGMPFSDWKRRVISQRAIELLASGQSVADVAFALGYDSVSGFIAMFKRLHGASPARFVAGAAQTNELAETRYFLGDAG
jgi:AraC-like DNA-binding protein